MNRTKIFLLFITILFSSIIVAAFIKRVFSGNDDGEVVIVDVPRITIDHSENGEHQNFDDLHDIDKIDNSKCSENASDSVVMSEAMPEGNFVADLFKKNSSKFSFVDTITYSSKVPWKSGGFAWIVDYARYYNTSKYFISRSLWGNYLSQNVRDGDKLNVFSKDCNIQFSLLVDLSRCFLWLFVDNLNDGTTTFLARYNVGVGKKDENKSSGFLTPTGKYSLGKRMGIYDTGSRDFFDGKKVTMIEIFGTRWIPFEEELGNCSEPARGEHGRYFGIHGLPWRKDVSGEWKEDTSSIGRYESDGCIRLLNDDIQELFAIISTKNAIIEVAQDFYQSEFFKTKIKAVTWENH